MDLYLLRHAIAEDGQLGQPDESRALTGEGIDKLKRVLAVAAAARVRPALILSSPYVRARQTAEIARERLGVARAIEFNTAFTPDADPVEAWNEIRNYREEPSLLIASHNPLCARLLPFLLNAPALSVDYKKAALAHVSLPAPGLQPRGTLEFFLSPKLA